ncbi:MAG: hypothetical protein ABIH41_05675, partial [Nanoarchaeota archaeon]
MSLYTRFIVKDNVDKRLFVVLFHFSAPRGLSRENRFFLVELEDRGGSIRIKQEGQVRVTG